MDKKQAHLEMIQGVVNRLSTDSFLLKGWTVVLISALFALAAANSNTYFVYLAYRDANREWRGLACGGRTRRACRACDFTTSARA